MKTLSILAFLAATPVWAAPTLDQITSANPTALTEGDDDDGGALGTGGDAARAAMIRLQVLLDRSGASVGFVDGYMGGATRAAIAAYERMKGLEVDGKLDAALWSVLTQADTPAATTYTITQEDAAFAPGPPIPEEWIEMAQMERLAYTSHAEMLAERFQMDQELLEALNPDADFGRAGTEITVAATRGGEIEAEVLFVEIDRATGRLRAYAGEGPDSELVFAAPAVVGSQQNPSPSGTMKVKAIAPDPNYTFDPKNIPEADLEETVVIPPGPNGPVGSMWIDLGKPTYGIHGTPYPTGVISMNSHGCVRLTNWDAEDLAAMVRPGETTVTFVSD